MIAGPDLAKLRKQQGFTQAELAKAIGVSTSTIAMYETSRRKPDDETLERLRNVLGLAEEETAAASVTETIASDELTTATDEPLSSLPKAQAVPSPEESHVDPNFRTTLALSREEAHVILFLRMNPTYRLFIDEYIRTTDEKRNQIEKAWRLIQAFQA